MVGSAGGGEKWGRGVRGTSGGQVDFEKLGREDRSIYTVFVCIAFSVTDKVTKLPNNLLSQTNACEK